MAVELAARGRSGAFGGRVALKALRCIDAILTALNSAISLSILNELFSEPGGTRIRLESSKAVVPLR